MYSYLYTQIFSKIHGSVSEFAPLIKVHFHFPRSIKKKYIRALFRRAFSCVQGKFLRLKVAAFSS